MSRFTVLPLVFLLSACPGEPMGEDVDMRPGKGKDGGGADLGQQAPPSWRWESPQPQGNNLRGVVGVPGQTAAQDDLLMVGDSGTILSGAARPGGVYRTEADDLVDARSILAVGRSGSGEGAQALVVGVYDLALRKVRGVWEEAPASQGGSGTLTAVWGSQVAGEFYVVGTTGRVFHVRGTIWQREAQGMVTQYLGGVWGLGAGPEQEVYAVGASGTILHRKGEGWSVEGAGVTGQQLNAVYGLSADEVYAVGDGGTILRRQGGAWAVEASPVAVGLTAVWGAGDEVFAVGQGGTVLRRSAGGWRQESTGLTGERLGAIWGTVRGGQATVYVVGSLGTMMRRERATWTLLSSRVTAAPLSAVWARRADEVYAVGASGLILRRRGTVAVGAWSQEGEGVTGEGLNAVAGHAASKDAEAQVYAVGTGGTILHRSGGAWTIEGAVLTGQELTALWVGADAVFVVGRGGRVARRQQDGKWQLERLPAGAPEADLLAVWGSGQGAALQAVAVGASGLLLRYAEGAWVREAEGATDQALVSVFGYGDEVVAVTGKGLALRRIGGRWVPDVITLPQGRSLVSGCAAPDGATYYAVATGGTILRRGPGQGGWSREGIGLTTLEMTGISAAPLNDVYLVGAGGMILHKF